jgi:hypothetical protein
VGSAFGLISWAYLNCIWLTVVHNLGLAFDVQLTMPSGTYRPFLDWLSSVVSSSSYRASEEWQHPHSELMKLGIKTSEASVAKYMLRDPKPPSQTWRTFLNNHVSQLASVDFFTVHDLV